MITDPSIAYAIPLYNTSRYHNTLYKNVFLIYKYNIKMKYMWLYNKNAYAKLQI